MQNVSEQPVEGGVVKRPLSEHYPVRRTEAGESLEVKIMGPFGSKIVGRIGDGKGGRVVRLVEYVAPADGGARQDISFELFARLMDEAQAEGVEHIEIPVGDSTPGAEQMVHIHDLGSILGDEASQRIEEARNHYNTRDRRAEDPKPRPIRVNIEIYKNAMIAYLGNLEQDRATPSA